MITRTITAKRPIDHDIDDEQSVQTKITEKTSTQNLQQNTSAGFESHCSLSNFLLIEI